MRPIAVAFRIVIVGTDLEMAIGPPKHVLFLRNRALDVGAPGDFRVGHVEHRETPAVRFGEHVRYLAPVAGNHRNSSFGDKIPRSCPPALQSFPLQDGDTGPAACTDRTQRVSREELGAAEMS